MKKIFLILSLLFLLFAASPSTGYTLTATLSGFDVQLHYNEPTTNSDNSPLVDLDHTTVWYDAGAGIIKGVDVPATSLTGGGLNVSATVSVPIAVGQEKDVIFWVTAFDKTGNESIRSNTVTVRLDRLAPAPPQ